MLHLLFVLSVFAQDCPQDEIASLQACTAQNTKVTADEWNLQRLCAAFREYAICVEDVGDCGVQQMGLLTNVKYACGVYPNCGCDEEALMKTRMEKKEKGTTAPEGTTAEKGTTASPSNISEPSACSSLAVAVSTIFVSLALHAQ